MFNYRNARCFLLRQLNCIHTEECRTRERGALNVIGIVDRMAEACKKKPMTAGRATFVWRY